MCYSILSCRLPLRTTTLSGLGGRILPNQTLLRGRILHAVFPRGVATTQLHDMNKLTGHDVRNSEDSPWVKIQRVVERFFEEEEVTDVEFQTPYGVSSFGHPYNGLSKPRFVAEKLVTSCLPASQEAAKLYLSMCLDEHAIIQHCHETLLESLTMRQFVHADTLQALEDVARDNFGWREEHSDDEFG